MPLRQKDNSGRGDVNYGHRVVLSVISLAALEIRGVAKLQGKGIRVDINGDYVNIDVYIDIIHGFSCPDVAFRVQENIKRSVETMTKLKVGTVNVNVLGVSFEDKK